MMTDFKKKAPLSGQDPDDLYSGYNEFPSALSTSDLEFDLNFMDSAKNFDEKRPGLLTSRGRTSGGLFSRIGTAAGFNRSVLSSRGMVASRSGLSTGASRPITGLGDSTGLNRPMTAVRGAGYKADSKKDPFSGTKSATPSIESRGEDNLEIRIKELEEKIGVLIEKSVLANCLGDFAQSLEYAKEAEQKEKSLTKAREEANVESIEWDTSFSVYFNLGTQYEALEMYSEALSVYQSITKNKFFSQGHKVKINMGNIYAKMNNGSKAVKMYRMAMDQLTNTHANSSLRLKLMHNKGIVFLKSGNAQDAASTFEYILAEKRSFKSALHLLIAEFMGGDKERVKRAFQELLSVPLDLEQDEDKYTGTEDPVSQLLVEVLKTDNLRKFEKEKKNYAERAILSSARMIAPHIENSFSEGYQWLTEVIRASQHSPLVHALEISKALVYLKQSEVKEAIEILKSFEKKETKVATAAATNLSFLFYLEGNLAEAEKYGEKGRTADYYNSHALVNLGNCHALRGDLERSRELYLEALSIDSSSVEALYNLGLMAQKLKFYEEALDYFHKILSLLPNHPHPTFQIGSTHELLGEIETGLQWYLKSLALTPYDAGILTKIASLYERVGDRRQAYQYFYDAYKCCPENAQLLEWLGSYMLNDLSLPERGLIFYKQGQTFYPKDPKWSMEIGACLRKAGHGGRAIEIYEKVVKEHPDNLDALQVLVKLIRDLGRKDLSSYEEQLVRKEKIIEAQNQKNNFKFQDMSLNSLKNRDEDNYMDFNFAGRDISLSSPLNSKKNLDFTNAADLEFDNNEFIFDFN